MGNVGPSLADVPIHLAHDANVLVAVEKRVLVFALDTHVARSAVRGLVGLETGMRQHDDQALGGFISRGDGHMLLGDELRKLWRWERLCS